MPYTPTVTDQTGQLLARGLASSAKDQPISVEDWDERLKRMQELGVSDDSLLMRGTEWRRGLAERREQFRDDARDSIRQALGFKAKDSAALGAAAKSAGKSGLLSSL